MASTTADTKPAPPAKPIKLRSACNCCFSAKVRCDGNKQGCRRCQDKRLDCQYSESRVGKVVGKRRKRPLATPLGPVPTDSWSMNFGESTLPSPSTSDASLKKSVSMSSWDSLMSFEDHNMFNFGECDQQLDQFRMPSRGMAMTNEPPMFVNNNGLPTPGMSPTDMCFLSPNAFESRPPSRTNSMIPDPSRGFTSRFATPVTRSPEPMYEDEETVCIKLLAHLKKNSGYDRQNYDSQLGLIQKTNAAIRRLLKSNKTRGEYTCQLLLSSISIHLVTMCEQLIAHSRSMENDFLQDQFALEATAEYFDTPLQPTPHIQHDLHDSAKAAIHESAVLCSAIGDMLKRKPMEGFQSMGRHESLHGELDHRLKKALMIIQ